MGNPLELKTYNAKEEAKSAANALVDFVNPFGADLKGFADHIVYRSHRTLQQSVGKVLFILIQRWAQCYREEQYDLRNAELCQKCHNICELMREEYNGDWDYLPMI